MSDMAGVALASPALTPDNGAKPPRDVAARIDRDRNGAFKAARSVITRQDRTTRLTSDSPYRQYYPFLTILA